MVLFFGFFKTNLNLKLRLGDSQPQSDQLKSLLGRALEHIKFMEGQMVQNQSPSTSMKPLQRSTQLDESSLATITTASATPPVA